MSHKSIHQFLPTLSPFDAIGNETLYIQKILKKLGFSSEIFAENINPSLKKFAKNFTEYKPKNDDMIIYHHSIGSSIYDFFKQFNLKIILIYHNITPPEFFENTNPELSKLLRLGLDQLNLLKNMVYFAVGDSEYNRQQLENIGYRNTGVLPILLDHQKYELSEKIVSQEKNILYVGRFAPSKHIEDVIRSFCYYNLNIDPNSNLFLVGQVSNDSQKYFEFLKKLTDDTQIKNIYFITDANDYDLVKYYSKSDLFVIMSKHEGFCVPLVECMKFKIPIIARSTTAIPYVLGNAGILIHNENFEEIGELMNLVINNKKLHDELIENCSKQLEKIYPKSSEAFISELISRID